VLTRCTAAPSSNRSTSPGLLLSPHSRRWLASSAAILLSGGAIVWTLDAQEQHRQIRQAWPVLDRDEQANDEDEEREREGQRPRRRWRLRERE